jgi:hypothetical protein
MENKRSENRQRKTDDIAICAVVRGGARGLAHDARLAEYRRLAELLDRVLAEPRVSSRYQAYWFQLLRERRKCYRALGLAPPDLTDDERMMLRIYHRDVSRRSYAVQKFKKSIGRSPQLSSTGASNGPMPKGSLCGRLG